jgi:HD-like signal output (HDOD) protein
VLDRLRHLFRRPSATARRASAPGSSATPAGRPPPATLGDVLNAAIDALGGAMAEIDPKAWTGLAAAIGARAEADPPTPPSFPNVVTQALSLAKQPELDLNELVGVVQRDAAIATAMLRIANSTMLAPASPITTVRGAIQSLGLQGVVEVVLGTAGKSFYAVASRNELKLFPELWHGMFDDAIANAFTAGRLALDIRGASSERALLAGLLADIGRPLALRILSTLIRDGAVEPALDPAIVLAAVDEVAPAISRRTIIAMNLPDELRDACVADADAPTRDAQIAQLIAAIGAIQRRSPRIRITAAEVEAHAARLALGPLVLRTLFAQRSQYMAQAAEMFGPGA